jgi:hypothetical protein
MIVLPGDASGFVVVCQSLHDPLQLTFQNAGGLTVLGVKLQFHLRGQAIKRHK